MLQFGPKNQIPTSQAIVLKTLPDKPFKSILLTDVYIEMSRLL